MRLTSRWIGGMLFSIGLGVVLVAQAPALDIKMGLWEITTTSSMGGEIAGIDTSKLSKEQAAKMQEAMKAMMASHTDTSKTCMTRDKFEKEGLLMNADEKAKCKQTINTNSKSVLDMNLACTGDQARTGHAHFEASSPSAFSGTMKFAQTEGGKTMNVDMQMSGKWLGADCGTVK